MTPTKHSTSRIRRAAVGAFILLTLLVASCATDTTTSPNAEPEVGATTTAQTATTTTTAHTDDAVGDDHESGDEVTDGDHDSSADDQGSDDGHGEDLTVIGAVINVEGDLTATTLITIVTEGGEEMTFRPSHDATFDDGPISHVRDHLVSGIQVLITYHELSDGSLEATHVKDADHDH